MQSNKILLVEGARQVGKSFIIRHVATELFPNFVEINFAEDKNGPRNFENVKTTEEFYLIVSSLYGQKLSSVDDTIIFIDEIQEYPHYLTLLKFLCQENRYRYIASGSLLGITLRRTTSIPIGSIQLLKMYPLDFEEFLIANSVGRDVIDSLKKCFLQLESPSPAIHRIIMDIFKRYLIVGGLPEAVNVYLSTRNVAKIRDVQAEIRSLYGDDATKYDIEHKLKIIRIYNQLPSFLAKENKRIVFREIENKPGRRSSDYEEEVDYLIDSGIALETKAISNPRFPLIESMQKNLFKLYLNDVGLLSELLFHNNVSPIIEDSSGINLGAIYECCVATELAAHDFSLFYYDNKKRGEVDFLIDDYESLSILPIEVKSGKDYKVHSALSRFMENPEFGVVRAYVLSNSGTVAIEGGICYMPVYMVMFLDKNVTSSPKFI